MNRVNVLGTKHRKIGSLGNRTRYQSHRRRRIRKEDHETLDRARSALVDQPLSFGVSIPRLGYVAVGRDQPVAHQKTGA